MGVKLSSLTWYCIYIEPVVQVDFTGYLVLGQVKKITRHNKFQSKVFWKRAHFLNNSSNNTWSYIFTVNTQMFPMFWLEIIISKVFRKWHIVVLGYIVDYYCSNFYFPLIQIIIQMTSFKVTRLLEKMFGKNGRSVILS